MTRGLQWFALVTLTALATALALIADALRRGHP